MLGQFINLWVVGAICLEKLFSMPVSEIFFDVRKSNHLACHVSMFRDLLLHNRWVNFLNLRKVYHLLHRKRKTRNFTLSRAISRVFNGFSHCWETAGEAGLHGGARAVGQHERPARAVRAARGVIGQGGRRGGDNSRICRAEHADGKICAHGLNSCKTDWECEIFMEDSLSNAWTVY